MKTKTFLYIVILVLMITPYGYAAFNEPVPKTYPVDLPAQTPKYNEKYQAYGEIKEFESSLPKEALSDAGSSVQVSATVLPTRIANLTENGLYMSANTDDEALYLAMKDGKRVAITPDIWDDMRACMRAATASTGAKICSV